MSVLQRPHRPAVITVAEVWRYPVKSMHGELLAQARLDVGGMSGDRLVHVRDDQGVLTGRTHSRLIPLRATLSPDGQPHVQGHAWDSPEAADLVRAAAGPQARLARYDGPERFDVLPLLVATDAEVERLGADRRRLRPNILLAGTEPYDERGWPGMSLRIGPDVVIGVDSVRLRCIVTTVDPDTATPDRDVQRRIHREFASRTALNCWIIKGGIVTVGDPVDVEPLPQGVDPDPYALRPQSWVTGGAYRDPISP